MWHHAGLANSFWIHAVKVKVHMYYITPVQSDLHNYKEYDPLDRAEITDGKFITIKGKGNMIGHSILPDKTKFSLEIRRAKDIFEREWI